MSDVILCPVCETENALDATHCEVCGERLVPPAEGEVVAPEENVLAMIAEQSEADATEVAYETSVEDSESSQEADVPSSQGPDALYSPLDGRAFYPGSVEYDEGFGPMGEELVATPPQSLPEVSFEAEPEDENVAGGFENEDAYESESTAPPVMDRSSAAFAAAFPVKAKERPVVEPLPVPGPVSATLTLYVNRQPVHAHNIETDETLIGRRDPRADAYPEFDLTEWDPDAHVSRKHACVYRQNRNYTLYVVSNSGTQLNADLLNLGDRRTLKSGDVIVLAGRFAMKFEIPQA